MFIVIYNLYVFIINMNFYDILEISHTASKQEIKQAYCRLAMLYHPDKNPDDPKTKEKFQEIHAAYKILYDDEKRKEYDEMSMDQRMQVFDLIKQYFTQLKPEYSYIYESIIDFAYPKDEKAFQEDVNTLNIKNIFTRITQKIKKQCDKKIICVEGPEYDLKVNIKERYNKLFKYVRVGDSESGRDYVVPIYSSKYKINDPEKGIIIVNVINEKDATYKIINDYDLLYIKNISLSQYIYGGKVKIYDPNENIFWFEFSSCMEKKPLFIMEGKGLPKLNVDNEINNRGKLFIYFNVEGINSVKEDDIAQEYYKVVEDTLKLMFPPIE